MLQKKFLQRECFFNQKLEFFDNTCFMPLNGGNIADKTLNSIKPVNHVLCFVIIRILWIS